MNIKEKRNTNNQMHKKITKTRLVSKMPLNSHSLLSNPTHRIKIHSTEILKDVSTEQHTAAVHRKNYRGWNIRYTKEIFILSYWLISAYIWSFILRHLNLEFSLNNLVHNPFHCVYITIFRRIFFYSVHTLPHNGFTLDSCKSRETTWMLYITMFL